MMQALHVCFRLEADERHRETIWGRGMATLNGFGNMFYGWKHQPGEDSSATKWLTIFYIPIVPLGRYRLKVLTDFNHEKTRIRATPVGMLASQENRFDILERTSLNWGEILRTYVSTFVGLPILMLGPFLVFLGLSKLLSLVIHVPKGELPLWLNGILMIGSAISLINLLWWPIWAIRRSRGMQLGFVPKRKLELRSN
jgi:hypothetical protein